MVKKDCYFNFTRQYNKFVEQGRQVRGEIEGNVVRFTIKHEANGTKSK